MARFLVTAAYYYGFAYSYDKVLFAVAAKRNPL